MYIPFSSLFDTKKLDTDSISICNYDTAGSISRNGELYIQITINRTNVPSSENATVTVNVTDDLAPVRNVSVEPIVSHGNISEEELLTGLNGKVSFNYTAPVTEMTLKVIMAVIINGGQPDEGYANLRFLVISFEDGTFPTVELSDPADGDMDVSNDTHIMITFSEPMNITNIDEVIRITPKISYNWGLVDRVLTLVPLEILRGSTHYLVNVHENATDLHGNPLLEANSFGFTVKSDPEFRMELILTLTSSQIIEGNTASLTVKAVNEDGSPVMNALVSIEFTGPIQISILEGLTDAGGFLNVTVFTSNVSQNILVNINISAGKDIYYNSRNETMITILDDSYRTQHRSLLLQNNISVIWTFGSRGVVDVNITSVENPSWFNSGFLELFLELQTAGTGEVFWTNITITGLDIPQGFDIEDGQMLFFTPPDGPWSRLTSMGTDHVNRSIWCNISKNDHLDSIIIAPRLINLTPKLKGEVRGRLVNGTGSPLNNTKVLMKDSGTTAYEIITDSDGVFTFLDVETGIYLLYLDKKGYNLSVRTNVHVSSGEREELGNISVKKEEINIIPADGKDKEDGRKGLPVLYIVLLIIFLILVLIALYKFVQAKYSQDDTSDRKVSRAFPKSSKSSSRPSTGFFNSSDEESFECPLCGSDVGEKDNRCNTCGARFVPNKLVCPDCGMIVLPGDKYCEMCGTVFGMQEGRNIDLSGDWGSANSHSIDGRVAISDFEVVGDNEISLYDLMKKNSSK